MPGARVIGRVREVLISSGVVELTGLEPVTSAMPWQRSSQLSYSPGGSQVTKHVSLCLRPRAGHRQRRDRPNGERAI